MKKSKVTSHILDIELGKPASDVMIKLELLDNENWKVLGEAKTDSDGRVIDWLNADLVPGQYRISFGVKDYFSRQNRECFYPNVSIDFLLKNLDEHFHVPLLLSSHGYSTYRGS